MRTGPRRRSQSTVDFRSAHRMRYRYGKGQGVSSVPLGRRAIVVAILAMLLAVAVGPGSVVAAVLLLLHGFEKVLRPGPSADGAGMIVAGVFLASFSPVLIVVTKDFIRSMAGVVRGLLARNESARETLQALVGTREPSPPRALLARRHDVYLVPEKSFSMHSGWFLWAILVVAIPCVQVMILLDTPTPGREWGPVARLTMGTVFGCLGILMWFFAIGALVKNFLRHRGLRRLPRLHVSSAPGVPGESVKVIAICPAEVDPDSIELVLTNDPDIVGGGTFLNDYAQKMVVRLEKGAAAPNSRSFRLSGSVLIPDASRNRMGVPSWMWRFVLKGRLRNSGRAVSVAYPYLIR